MLKIKETGGLIHARVPRCFTFFERNFDRGFLQILGRDNKPVQVTMCRECLQSTNLENGKIHFFEFCKKSKV